MPHVIVKTLFTKLHLKNVYWSKRRKKIQSNLYFVLKFS